MEQQKLGKKHYRCHAHTNPFKDTNIDSPEEDFPRVLARSTGPGTSPAAVRQNTSISAAAMAVS